MSYMVDIKDLINKAFDAKIAGMQEFYLANAQNALNAWRSLEIDSPRLNELIRLD